MSKKFEERTTTTNQFKDLQSKIAAFRAGRFHISVEKFRFCVVEIVRIFQRASVVPQWRIHWTSSEFSKTLAAKLEMYTPEQQSTTLQSKKSNFSPALGRILRGKPKFFRNQIFKARSFNRGPPSKGSSVVLIICLTRGS